MPNPIDNKPDVLSRISYARCGFSTVEGDVISVFASYFDESGTHNKRFLVIGGYTAEVDRWADFSNKWNALMRDYGLSHFHMKEFRHEKSKPYAHLNRGKRRDLLEGLLDTIKETAIFGNFAIISPYHYDRITTPKFRSDFGSAFALSAMGAAASAVASVQEYRPGNHRVGIFFEQGHKNIMQALELVRFRKTELEEIDGTGINRVTLLEGANKHVCPPGDPFRRNTVKIGAIGMGSKDEMPPLQAADILAYCVYSVLVHKDMEFCGGIIDRIEQKVPHYFSHMSPDRIRDLADRTMDADREWKTFSKDVHFFSKEMKKVGVEVTKHPHGLIVRSGNPLTEDVQARMMQLLRKTK